MNDYKMTIGLEIHAELNTNSKMFCGCKNDQEEKRPNVNICPVCLGLPGTLPTVNKEAVKKVLMVGKAVGGKLADFSEFDRKNYFYPDIPKGYQISQYKYPLVLGGELSGVKLTRIHLEEDTAKSTHDTGDFSLVDFNRAGLPLMELVTEPVIKSAKEAGDFGRELQLLLRYLNVSFANMEKGQMRVEVNISVSNTDTFGTKVEVKNINSFRSAEKAIEYEIKRQVDLLLKGEKVMQETRGFDENKNQTFSQRSKEDSHDYRYFTDPDIPKFQINKLFSELEIPETPSQKRLRFAQIFGIKSEDIEFFINNQELSDLFEDAGKLFTGDLQYIKILSNYITSDLSGLIKKAGQDFGNINASGMYKLVDLIRQNKISSRGAKDILKIMFENGGDPFDIANSNNLILNTDENAVKEVIDGVLSENESIVKDYKSGKENALQFLIGQSMKKLKGSGNPQTIKDIILSKIS
jgi:aspartyl-tRNA(Asn)/glutamyl-tRNA(Gln) amidotransferase subunit B